MASHKPMRAALLALAVAMALACAGVSVSASTYARISLSDDSGDLRFGAAGDVRLSRDAAPAGVAGAPAALKVNAALNVVGPVNAAAGMAVAGAVNATGAVSASNIIASAVTLYVPSAAYPTLLDALNWLSGKSLLALVTIRIADGTYNAQPNFVVSDLPSPDLVRIYGNTQTPGAVQLNQAAAGAFFTFDGVGAQGVAIAGVTLNAAGSAAGTTAGLAGTIGIAVASGAAVSTRGSRLVLNGFERAVVVSQNAHFQAPAGSLTASLCAKNCLLASERAYVYAPQATLSGTGASAGLAAVEVGASAFVSVVAAAISNFAVGVWCDGTGDSADYTNTTFGSGVGSSALCVGGRGAATLNVGPTRTLKGLADVMNFLAPKTLKDIVLVKFDAGQYSTPNMALSHPQAPLIYFMGDLTNAGAVELKQNAYNVGSYFLIFQGSTASFGSFIGFTISPYLTGVQTKSPYNGLYVGNGAVLIGSSANVWSDPRVPAFTSSSRLIINNWAAGVSVNANAGAYMNYLSLSGCDYGVSIGFNSFATLSAATLSGTGTANVATSVAVQIADNSVLGVSGTTLNNWVQGYCIGGGSFVENNAISSSGVTTLWACSHSTQHN